MGVFNRHHRIGVQIGEQGVDLLWFRPGLLFSAQVVSVVNYPSPLIPRHPRCSNRGQCYTTHTEINMSQVCFFLFSGIRPCTFDPTEFCVCCSLTSHEVGMLPLRLTESGWWRWPKQEGWFPRIPVDAFTRDQPLAQKRSRTSVCEQFNHLTTANPPLIDGWAWTIFFYSSWSGPPFGPQGQDGVDALVFGLFRSLQNPSPWQGWRVTNQGYQAISNLFLNEGSTWILFTRSINCKM